MPVLHRKQIRHYDIPGHAHELTFSTQGRTPFLCDSGIAEVVCGAIAAACTLHRFGVIAFVIMPEHIHLLVRHKADTTAGQAGRGTPSGEPSPSVSDLLYAIKRPSSYRIRAVLQREQPKLLDRLTVIERGRTLRRIWLAGPGYDRNIISLHTATESANYIHLNPIRRGLCGLPSEWPWSSWRQWNRPLEPVPAWMPVVDRAALS